jgi:aminoglycoside 2'-N-acetyltransferase I
VTFVPAAFDIERVRVRIARTSDLSTGELAAIRAVLDAAFAPDDPFFPDSDWEHALGGVHFVGTIDDQTIAHASVVPRQLHVAERPFRTGYVEAVGTMPEYQGRGVGSVVMRAANGHIVATYELGALGTGEHGFYERLGWRAWQGPTFVRAPGGDRRTTDEDGGIMVLPTPSTPAGLDVTAPLSCDWRPGDVW